MRRRTVLAGPGATTVALGTCFPNIRRTHAQAMAGKFKYVPSEDRAEIEKMVAPVMAPYAKEIGADAIYDKISTIK